MRILEETYQKDLLVKLSHGDEQAFNALYKAYSPPLYYRVLRMVKNADIADELLQELFIKLWDKRNTLDTEKSFQAYMYTVAQNLVYNYFRKVANDQSLIQSLIVNSADHYLDGQELLENKETAGILQKAIDQLSPQRKQAFQLCKIEGRSYDEAAGIMGISVATVNSHITKSLQTIKAYLLKNQDTTLLLMTVYTINVLKS
ncbi:RNA polymerase sigma factor [Pedobacter africanus]|uniref:RNA polymerase sigma factor n=1 Tax=Pedobacter africanus TaxID=151894 RepID=UPI000A06D7E3|nr:RNA polymerase sigma-70 factor [Pedobacter africanus]